jgi:hypothetical protein
MTIQYWAPQTIVIPGEQRRPTVAGAILNTQPANAGFESATDGENWTATGTWAFPSIGSAFEGDKVARFPQAAGTGELASDTEVSVIPGQEITAKCYVRLNNPGALNIAHNGRINLDFLDDFDAVIEAGTAPAGSILTGINAQNYGIWRELSITRTAPAGAAKARIRLTANAPAGTQNVEFDLVSWNYAGQTAAVSELLYEATQAQPGLTGASEPNWPTVVGETVVDNEVTWTAIEYTPDTVTWEAKPILVSGATEPDWPTEIGANVLDNTISWTAITRRITDSRCPNTAVVAIAASKVFCGDDDIVAFSATVNPLDWSTPEDAGYLPFGLQTYGASPVSALGLYRSNLVVFNAAGFQMWQVDEDPANHAILDAAPVGCPYHRSVQPVSNDLVFLTEVGIRNIGIAGASTNLQAGFFGKQVDPMVQALLAVKGEPTVALFYPGTGQYWLVFGDEAIVLTMNGGTKDMSWSRYTFPEEITDWTLLDDALILRAGDFVWEFTDEVLQDDVYTAEYEYEGEEQGTPFDGYVAWPYLDFGQIAREKQLIGFDLAIDGEVEVSFGYAQENFALATEPYAIDGDTLTGQVIPMPLAGPSFQMRLTFPGTQETRWEWQASVLYLNDLRGGT